MLRDMLKSLGFVAVLALVACGGSVEESTEAPLSNQEQELPMCKVDVPKPCPDGYYCDGRTCRPELQAAPVDEQVSDGTVTQLAICPMKWTCNFSRFYNTQAACETACGRACWEDYACNGTCVCP
ncbi:hypothetical protein HPC49_40350 [Pyxidicoccus fallax]|uniref:Lipoprotein n=1 Tax=Pyxidicoccus fallax TaxID=394095 RepID=A0A848LHP4_9BACT|nr:hypothetical protein [Pyxidicoccus fallax]NMO16991.1 hypothetical protein [Pyxidicoccus fallax]NPC84452.1 hypothetical protein [Pyxidicoccus fallax]